MMLHVMKKSTQMIQIFPVLQIHPWPFGQTSQAAIPTACTPMSRLTWNSVSLKAILMPKWVIKHHHTDSLTYLVLFPQCWATCKEPWSFWRQSCEHKSLVFLSTDRISLPWGSLSLCHLFTDCMKRTVKPCTNFKYFLWIDSVTVNRQAFIFMFAFFIKWSCTKIWFSW